MSNILIRVVDVYIFKQTENTFLFLLLKRSKNKIYENLWQGVTGKIEAGETAWEAAKRELKEETGLTPSRMFIADYVSKFYEQEGDRINLIPVFGVEVDSLDVELSDEHSNFEWVEIIEAEKRLTWTGQKIGISKVYEMIKSKDIRLKWSEIKLKKEI